MAGQRGRSADDIYTAAVAGYARHNLPTYDTPLIGRDTEVADCWYCYTRRLVTLTGSGGVGKTRLALTVAASALTENMVAALFEDGAFFVPLDSIEATEMAVAAAIAKR